MAESTPSPIWDYDFVSDDTDAVYEIYEVESGTVVDWANTHEDAIRIIKALEAKS